MGAILKDARLAKGLTQEEVAKQIGITSRQYVNYETYGRFSPQAKILHKLSKILDIPTKDLFDLLDAPDGS
ncbi:MAG: helix-turn-helix domain-containing protein [Eubacteriaceae bacterium]|nr:helix-turn-helix domain-containing protein [Eubacteriaceae bacterium]